MHNIKHKKLKEGESLEDFDHVLDMVGRGFQLVVDIAHAPCTTTTKSLTMTLQFFDAENNGWSECTNYRSAD